MLAAQSPDRRNINTRARRNEVMALVLAAIKMNGSTHWVGEGFGVVRSHLVPRVLSAGWVGCRVSNGQHQARTTALCGTAAHMVGKNGLEWTMEHGPPPRS